MATTTPATVTILVGGRWHAFDLFRELRARDVDARIVTSYPRFKCRQWGLPDDRCVSLPISVLLEQVVRRVSGDRGFARWQDRIHRLFARGAARHAGEAGVLHGWSGFSLPALRRARAAGRSVVIERGSAHMEAQTALLAEESRLTGVSLPATHPGVVRTELAEYIEADAVQVPSSFVAATFAQRATAPVRVNTLGVNLATFPQRAAPPAPGAPFRVLFVGSKSMRKGVHYLVRAFRDAALPAAELRLVGGDTAETARLLGLPSPQIHSIPHVPQPRLAKEYAGAAVFVIASIEEGLAMVQAQALAVGVPLICTANTGGEDLLRAIHPGAPPPIIDGIREYSAGFVVPIREPAAIAACLRRLYGDRELLIAKGAAAANIRRHRLDWGAYAERCLTLYRTLAPNHP